MVEIWAGDAQTVPAAHLGSPGASHIAPGAQIASLESRAKLGPPEQFADANAAQKCSQSVKDVVHELPAPRYVA